MQDKEYLGDGLYVENDGYGLRLSTDREYGTHYVYLEPNVYKNFVEYVKRIKERNEHLAEAASKSS